MIVVMVMVMALVVTMMMVGILSRPIVMVITSYNLVVVLVVGNEFGDDSADR